MAEQEMPSDIDLKVPARGPAGKDGKTPIRGIDYWTQADQDAIKQWVEDAIENGTGAGSNLPKTYGRKFACFGDSIWSDDVCKIGTMIPDFNGMKLIGNFAIGAATASDWKDTNGTNISKISLARAKNASSSDNTLSNQVRRLLQWTTPKGQQIKWTHPTDGQFQVDKQYGVGLGHTSDVPDVIGISIGVNDGYIPQVAFNANVDYYLALSYKDLLGTVSMATGLRWAIETLRSAYPFAQIFLFTPFQCAMEDSNNYTYDITKQKVDVIKKVGQFESVPVIDQFGESGLSQAVITANSNEGLHPNYIYARRAAAFDANRICELYYSLTEHALPVPHADKSNLWTGTDDYTGSWVTAAYTQSPSLYQGLTVYTGTASGGNIAQPVTLEPGKYTFSCFMKWEGTVDSNHTLKPSLFISRFDDTTSALKGVIYDVSLSDNSLSKDWCRFTFTFTLAKEERVLIYISQGWGTAQGALYLAGQKLEKGDKATPYVKMDGTTVTAPDYTGQVTSKYSE